MSGSVTLNSRIFSGRSTSKSSSEVHSKGKNESKNTRLNVTGMIAQIESMVKFAKTPVSNLDSVTHQKLMDLRKAAWQMNKTPSYKEIVASIKKHFGGDGELESGTVGAFFYGCMIPSDYEGCLTCSQYCAGSIPPAYVAGLKECDSNVAVRTKSGLRITYVNSASDELLIHTSDNFESISDADYNTLKKMGIKSVILSSSKDDSCKQTRSSLDSYSLRSKEDFMSEDSQFQKQRKTQYKTVEPERIHGGSNNTEGWGFAWIIGAAIIILVIIGIVAYFFCRSSPVQAKSAVQKKESCYSPGYC